MSPDPEATIVYSAEPNGPASGVPGGAANPDAKVAYLFGSEIARGGMGSILRAEDCKLPRTVAVKIILSEINADEGQKQRFINEAAVLAQLAHPNIVPVYDIGRDPAGQLFYSMKLVKGRTLQAVLNDLRAGAPDAAQHYTLDRLLTIFRKVCDALAFAHSHGIIHRDLKPENVMVGEFGEVLVMDWGLAKTLDKETGRPGDGETSNAALPASPSLPISPSGLTLQGSVMGTPQYMSPEQAMGHVTDMDARSDIFSLGGILYAILTLRPPVEGSTLEEVLRKVSNGSITPPSAFGATTGKGAPGVKGEVLEARKIQPLPHCPGGRVPAALSAVAMKALSLPREQRYQEVAAFSADVEAYQGGFATRAENAGVVKQLALLIKRHKALFGTAAAAWLIITALAVWFVMSVTRERNRATANEQKATRNAETAAKNAEIAQANERWAEDKEREAVAEKENVRRALAESALALAEAAYREANGPAMQAALDRVPSDLRDASWSYLLEQSDTSVARISVDGGVINSVVAHPKLPGVFAVADSNKKITILEARTGVRLLQFNQGWTDAYANIAFSPDGERIAVGKGLSSSGPVGVIGIYSARDGTKLQEWDAPAVFKLEFSPDGRRLLQQASQLPRQSQLNLWDATNGKLLWTDTLKVDSMRASITPDGQQVLLGFSNGAKQQLALRKLEDGAETRILEVLSVLTSGQAGHIASLAIHPDGREALWGAINGFVHGIDLRDGRLLFSTRVHSTHVRAIAFTPAGERFVSVARLPDGRQSIQISSASTGMPLQSLIGGSGDASALALNPLSGELLIGGPSSRLWNVTGTAAKWMLQLRSGGGQALAGAAWLGSDDWFLGPAKSSCTALVDLRETSTLWNPDRTDYLLANVSADGRVAALGRSSYREGNIQILHRKDDKFQVAKSFPLKGTFVALRLNPSGDRLALASNGLVNFFSVIDSTTGTPLVTMNRKSLPIIHEYQWLSNGTQVVGLATANQTRGAAKSEERIVVWDTASGQQVCSVVHPTALDCLVVAPDGKSFAAAGADKLVHVFDTETLAERQAFRAHDGPITALAWHPARPIVATASEDLTIKLWNLDTGRRLETLRGPTDTPRVLNFSPSGQRLACAALDRTVRIWEPPSLNNATLDAPKTDGWEDLLAQLKADDVKANGNGWTLSGGVLMSPEKAFATLPLSGNYARRSYQVRVTLRRLNAKNFFGVILPVADQQVCFYLDNYPDKGFYTDISSVDGKHGFQITGDVHGQQIKDTEPHELEISVELSARTARITATLDERPLYDWTGPATALSLSQNNWPTLPQPNLFLSNGSADWVVSAVKVKRLEK